MTKRYEQLIAALQFRMHQIPKFARNLLNQKKYATSSVSLELRAPVLQQRVFTGYYLPPGAVLKLKVLSSHNAQDLKQLQILVNTHTDSIARHAKWKRYPQVAFEVRLAVKLEVTNPVGGMVYFLFPAKAKITSLRVALEGVVETFNYLSTAQQPVLALDKQGEWGQLTGKLLTMSVPKTAVQALKDPKSLMGFWDGIVAKFHWLTGTEPTRMEHFVADTQISAGYMHAGYPIMTWMDVVTPEPQKGRSLGLQLDLARLTTEGSWGHFHEIGHNLQKPAWTFDGQVEVTCNFYSLLGYSLCCNKTPLTTPWVVNGMHKVAPWLRKYSGLSE